MTTLIDRQRRSGPPLLPDGLAGLYAGDLYFPAPPEGRPYVIANFVSTIDGVVSFQLPGKSGGAEISGCDPGDRFIMGLLRASADAVIVGSGTFHAASPRHRWSADAVYPAAAELYAQYRQGVLQKPAYPLHVIVSASGKVDLARAAFHTPGLRALILTTGQGRKNLYAAGAEALAAAEVRVLSEAGARVQPSAIASLLRTECGVHLLLHEGGPLLFGGFLADGLVDELFLTIAPQIAGRSEAFPRPGIVSGAAYSPGSAPWLSIVSLKQQGDHLYLRYHRKPDPAPPLMAATK
jgi:riboflavin biosynthesis pyrimidine reductase